MNWAKLVSMACTCKADNSCQAYNARLEACNGNFETCMTSPAQRAPWWGSRSGCKSLLCGASGKVDVPEVVTQRPQFCRILQWTCSVKGCSHCVHTQYGRGDHLSLHCHRYRDLPGPKEYKQPTYNIMKASMTQT